MYCTCIILYEMSLFLSRHASSWLECRVLVLVYINQEDGN